MDSAGQEFRWGIAGRVCLCFTMSGPSAGRLGGWGQDSHKISVTYRLTVDRGPCLGSLTTWWPEAKSKRPKRERGRKSEREAVRHMLYSSFLCRPSLGPHITSRLQLSIGQGGYQTPSRFRESEKRVNPLVRRQGKHIGVSAFGKYILPPFL